MMQNSTEYNGTEGLTLQGLIKKTKQEALAEQFYRRVAAQYIQLTYSDKDSWLATGYNYLAYACNHIMVLLGDLMSYFSCNSVNKQLKTDVSSLTDIERAKLYLACVDEEIKEEFNDNAGIEGIELLIIELEASNLASSNDSNCFFPQQESTDFRRFVDDAEATLFLNNYIDAAYEVPSFSRKR